MFSRSGHSFGQCDRCYGVNRNDMKSLRTVELPKTYLERVVRMRTKKATPFMFYNKWRLNAIFLFNTFENLFGKRILKITGHYTPVIKSNCGFTDELSCKWKPSLPGWIQSSATLLKPTFRLRYQLTRS